MNFKYSNSAIFTARIRLLLVLMLYPCFCYSESIFSIKVLDSNSLETIPNVAISIKNKIIGITNTYGYLSKAIDSVNCNSEIEISHIGYSSQIIHFECASKKELIIYLKPQAEDITKVTVKSNKNFKKDFGSISIPISYIKKIPYVLGEIDPLKAVQTLPGVSSGFEANSGIYVRGGNIDQTAIYLDDAPVYNMGHVYGFFSPFDGEALKSFTFYNSGIYSGFGSRGSSILDVRFREGNLKKQDGSFSLGFLSSKLLLEGPLIKNKLSYLGSIRFAYPLFIASSHLRSKDFTNYFIDGNVKLKWVVNSYNTLYLSSFISSDEFSMRDVNLFTVGNASINKYKWGNKTGTFRWNHINSNKSFFNTILSVSKFSSRAFFLESVEPDFGNELKNYNFKTELDNINGNFKNCRFGFATNYYQSNQAILYFHRTDSANFKQNLLPQNNAIEACLFGENNYKFKPLNLTLISNLRFGLYFNINDKYNDIIFEPRIKFIKTISKINLYAAYDKSSQYQSYVGNRQIAIPSDYWVQASNQFKSQKIHAFSIGINKELKKARITTEAFFKKYNNALDVRDGATLFRNKNVLNDILYVKSQAYGLELLIEKHIGKMQGHCSYTLSRSIRKSTQINNNVWFASNFDRTHMLNLALLYKPNQKWSFGILGIYQSGTPFTASYSYVYLYSLRNEYRLPNYYRMDASITKNFKIRKKINCEWNISVFNIFFIQNRTSQYGILGSFASIPTLPSFTLKVKF